MNSDILLATISRESADEITVLAMLQAVTLKRYAAHLSLTALVVFMGTLQSIAVTFVMEHKASVWSIGWDMNLLAAAYAVSLQAKREVHLIGSMQVRVTRIILY